MQHTERVAQLRAQGVELPAPEAVELGPEVRLEQLHGPGTVLHAGTKLFGKDLLICPGARIGFEAPATVENCAVGPGVSLHGGYFSEAVFLDGASMGSGAHVRGGTLLEEQANGAHTVGLKQTVLLPFVTLGSLINFCDALMAGGTSRKDHSEVGSSFIHFNYTPFGKHGDKATASLIGDVPRGVMLRSPRVFLGGQGGLVGPLTIDYGTVLAAGFVYRRDYGPNELVVGESLPVMKRAFSPKRYGRVRAKVEKNLRYIGNLAALWHWYEAVRLPLAGGDALRRALYRRAQAAIASGIKERIKRLADLADGMGESMAELEADTGRGQTELGEQRAFAAAWPALGAHLEAYVERGEHDRPAFERFRRALEQGSATSYLERVAGFSEECVAAGTVWLEGIVARTADAPHAHGSVASPS
ncbi:MAG: hypothetical protein IT371_03250 [Deltaproteobacteria bacterium]|nr:hypothetical protein [Deltaproteobacteria bacterium]